MGASARRNNYVKANSAQIREAERNESTAEVEKWHQKLFVLDAWDREIEVARLIVAARKDKELQSLVAALVRSGRWHVEFMGALERVPRLELTSRLNN